MTQTEREMRAEFEGAFRAHWRPEMSIGANSLNVAKIFAWSMWQAATALAKHEGAQAVGWAIEWPDEGTVLTNDACDIEIATREGYPKRPLYTAAPDTALDTEYCWLVDGEWMGSATDARETLRYVELYGQDGRIEVQRTVTYPFTLAKAAVALNRRPVAEPIFTHEDADRLFGRPGDADCIVADGLAQSHHDGSEDAVILAQHVWRMKEAAQNLADRLARTSPATSEPAVLSEIAAERQRQISVEGWTQEHDDHSGGQLAKAAACYADRSCWPGALHPPLEWPWDAKWFKPGSPRRMLIKAGALIVAEIERIDRAAPRQDAALKEMRRES